MRVHVLGVGDTFSERHHTHALLLEEGDFRLAIDCPDSYRRVLAAAREKERVRGTSPDVTAALDLTAIDHVLVTHVHGDHMNGLEGLAFFKRFAQGKKVQLWTIAAVREQLWEGRLVASMGRLWNGTAFVDLSFDDYFAWHELSLDTETEVGPFRIRARRTMHHVPTSALLVTSGAQSVGISSDTAFDPSLVAFLAGADLVIHETNHGPAHTAYADLLALPEDVRRKMRLIHYPDEHDVDGSVIPALREGEVLELS